MSTLYNDKKECCGCTACKSICANNAIEMEQDEEGFLYPNISEKLCISCGLCKKVCAFKNGYERALNIPDAYAVKHKDMNVRLNSRSGGMFTAITDFVLNFSGVVYGAGYRQHFVVCHKRATNKAERDEFRGSKYVQSELSNTYKQVKKDLEKNNWVLFSGTPCQTAGLSTYLNEAKTNKGNLIICDIICHGTPTPKAWMDYIAMMEKRHKGEITKVDFRNKKLFGWKAHRETFEIKGKTYNYNTYATLFYKHDILRPACFNCKYTNINRPSDITLADFWGVDYFVPKFNDNKGISLVLINNEKGRWLFNNVKDQLEYKKCPATNLEHPNLKKPTECPISREQFWKDYRFFGFEYIARKYTNCNFKVRVKRSIKNKIKKLILFK